MNPVKKTALVVCGTLFVGLGVLGMLLPVLPTTPFLLLAALCYSHSSTRFYQWLITNRWFGEYIRNYREGRGMVLKQKILTIVLLWLSILYGAFFATDSVWIQIILICVGLGVTTHLVRIKTYRPPNASPAEKHNLPEETA